MRANVEVRTKGAKYRNNFQPIGRVNFPNSIFMASAIVNVDKRFHSSIVEIIQRPPLRLVNASAQFEVSAVCLIARRGPWKEECGHRLRFTRTAPGRIRYRQYHQRA